MSLPAVSLRLFNCKCQSFGSGRGNHTGNEVMGKMDWRGPRRETLSAADPAPLGTEQGGWRQGGGSRGKEEKTPSKAGEKEEGADIPELACAGRQSVAQKCSWKGPLKRGRSLAS